MDDRQQQAIVFAMESATPEMTEFLCEAYRVPENIQNKVVAEAENNPCFTLALFVFAGFLKREGILNTNTHTPADVTSFINDHWVRFLATAALYRYGTPRRKVH